MERMRDAILVIFGLTGDLARRKILPAIYRLAAANLLPARFRVVGISRKGTTKDDILHLMEEGNGADLAGSDEGRAERARTRDFLAARVSVVAMNIGEPSEYETLARHLEDLESEMSRDVERADRVFIDRLFYLAIPATLFPLVARRLAERDINARAEGGRECKFLIEKPFGHDRESAKGLIALLSRRFADGQIYRIDHYLAKETAQNILAFRFGNPLFSVAWTGERVSHIMITASESIGIEGRASFYEGMGAMRDLVQSHLLQLLALVTMRKPQSMTPDGIHREKERLLSRVRPPARRLMAEETVRGQYRSYGEEAGKADSTTETYAAIKLSIDCEEWRGVPVFIRTGKALREKVTEITLVFSDPEIAGLRNYLTIRIQPNEGIVIDLHIKKPGFDPALEDVQLDFCYRDRLAGLLPDAYERVLVDALRGDQSLFATGREVLECWRITQPILEAWRDGAVPLRLYENGSWGPEEAARMIEKTGISWFGDEHRVCPL